MAALTADGLLRVAETLLPDEPGRPLDAAIRRSISTAYYAIFAALRQEIARPYASETKTAAGRLLEHSQAHEVCSALSKQKKVPWLADRPACGDDLVEFTKSFVTLQLQRERADYDDSYEPRKRDALAAIDQARRGIASLERAQQSCPEQVQATCVAIVARTATRRRMTR